MFGIDNNYLFNIYQSSLTSSPQFKTIVCRTENLSENQVSDIRLLFEGKKKGIKYNVFEVRLDFISITFYENLSFTKSDKLNETLRLISEELLVRKIKPKYTSEGSSYYYNFSGEGVILSKSDFNRLSGEITQAENQNELDRHSYLNGIWGSLLYSLPVIVLWVLLAIYLERLSTGLGLIIAWLGYLGYEKFNGKLGIWTKWILIISNIIVIILANITTTYFMLWRLDIPANQIFNVMVNDTEVKKYFYDNLAISMILGIVGWLWIVVNIKTKRNYIKEAEKL